MIMVGATATMKAVNLVVGIAVAKITSTVIIVSATFGSEAIAGDATSGGLTTVADIAASRGFEFLIATLTIVALMTRRLVIVDPNETERLEKIDDRLSRIEEKLR